jgi:hypothetical protein
MTGRTIYCESCGKDAPRKGSRVLPNGKYGCAVCASRLLPKPAAKQAAHEDKGPWRPSTVQQPPTAPAQRATGDNVIRDDAPRLGKFGVDAGDVVPYFSALGIGRYQRTSSWAERYLEGGRS